MINDDFCFCHLSGDSICLTARFIMRGVEPQMLFLFAFIQRSTNAMRQEAGKALFNNQCSLQWTKPSKIFKVAMFDVFSGWPLATPSCLQRTTTNNADAPECLFLQLDIKDI